MVLGRQVVMNSVFKDQVGRETVGNIKLMTIKMDKLD